MLYSIQKKAHVKYIIVAENAKKQKNPAPTLILSEAGDGLV